MVIKVIGSLQKVAHENGDPGQEEIGKRFPEHQKGTK
jgi:hypothetical protein